MEGANIYKFVVYPLSPYLPPHPSLPSSLPSSLLFPPTLTSPIPRLVSPQHGVQLQQNNEDTKGEMPWLQLEDENLDVLARKVPDAKPRESKSVEAEPVVLLVSVSVSTILHLVS